MLRPFSVRHQSPTNLQSTDLLPLSRRPKEGDFDFLSDYQQARQLGAEAGGRQRCRPAYSECPLSVFNFIPDMMGEDVLLPLGNITNSLG